MAKKSRRSTRLEKKASLQKCIDSLSLDGCHRGLLRSSQGVRPEVKSYLSKFQLELIPRCISDFLNDKDISSNEEAKYLYFWFVGCTDSDSALDEYDLSFTELETNDIKYMMDFFFALGIKYLLKPDKDLGDDNVNIQLPCALAMLHYLFSLYNR
jgi:hypothetical protein